MNTDQDNVCESAFKLHGMKQMKDVIFPGITADYFSTLVCTKIFLPALDPTFF